MEIWVPDNPVSAQNGISTEPQYAYSDIWMDDQKCWSKWATQTHQLAYQCSCRFVDILEQCSFSPSKVIKSNLIMRCRMPTKHHPILCFQKNSFCYITRFTFWLLCIRQLPHNDAIIKQTFHIPTSLWWTNWLKSLSQNLYTTFIFSSSDSLFDINFPSYPVNQI